VSFQFSFVRCYRICSSRYRAIAALERFTGSRSCEIHLRCSSGSNGVRYSSRSGDVTVALSTIEFPSTRPSGAGEEAMVTLEGHVERIPDADVTNALSWRQRRLVFHDTPLSEVIAEFHRYGAIDVQLDGPDIPAGIGCATAFSRRARGASGFRDIEAVFQHLEACHGISLAYG
jgi:ferric-dicitrate binding protein FerR (iron transport regulator)